MNIKSTPVRLGLAVLSLVAVSCGSTTQIVSGATQEANEEATTAETDTDAAVIDSGPVLRYLEPVVAQGGEAAEIRGILQLESDCLYVYLDEVDERYPVVWPNSTSWNGTKQVVVLVDGSEVGIGEAVWGGGGYSDSIERVESQAGPEAAALAAECVDNTFGEIAFVNNSVSGISKAE